jgi:hypothetical protein
MKSRAILYPPGGNDECYTPAYAVAPIVQHVPRGAVVWCPFDTEESQFVVQLRVAGHEVAASHLVRGQDFFTYEPANWDVLVSNPPFTNKRKIFERALSFGKPFALVMTCAWLNDAAPKKLFKDKDLQLMLFDKRIEFLQADQRTANKITFSSAYYCYNFLPKQIMIVTLDKPAAPKRKHSSV